jgi:hypothetical protein
MNMQLPMRQLMLRRRVTVPAAYVAYNACLVSYELPLLKHCFIVCAGQQAEQDEGQLLTFFWGEAQRLAAQHVGDAQAFVFIYSGSTVRKRANVHAHMFVVQHRWQKTLVYTLLATKNFALLLQSSVNRAFQFR